MVKRCRVGKGEGKTFPFGNAYRTPCPPAASIRVLLTVVGTANARLSLDEMQCHRLCPPYEEKQRGLANATLQALKDEPIEIALVADRDGQAALQCKMEAGVIGLRRCRHASASRDAVLVLSNARCRQRGRADGQRRCSDCQAHRVSPLSGVSFRRKGVQAGGRIQAARMLIRHKQTLLQLTIPGFLRCAAALVWACRSRAWQACSPVCHSAGAAPC